MRNGSAPVLVIIAALALPAAADAQSRSRQKAPPRETIAILPFTGPRASVPRGQVVRELCRRYRCIPTNFFVRSGRPDWDRIRNRKAVIALSGGVGGTRTDRTLQIEVFRPDETTVLSETIPLARNFRLSAANVKALGARIDEAVKLATAPPPPSPEDFLPPPLPPDLPPPVAATPPPAAEVAPPVVAEAPPPVVAEPPPPVQPAAPPKAPPDPRQPLVALEVGVDLVHRSLQYDNLQVRNLRVYRTEPVVAVPRLRVEIHPFSRQGSPAVAAIGIEADLLLSVGLVSTPAGDPNRYDTHFRQVDAGFRWPIRMGRSGFSVVPVGGYRYSEFEIGTNSANITLTGMPDTRYQALRGGLALEFALRALDVFARAEYLHPFGYGNVRAFFPNVTGYGLQFEAGFGVQLFAGTELRLRGHYGTYAMTFNPEPGATYRADGASDDYLGGAILLRYSWGGARP